MTSDQWELMKVILEKAVRVPSEQRKMLLDSECAGDAELRSELESLVASHRNAGSNFLTVAAPEMLFSFPYNSRQASSLTAIGNYRLLQELGHGGMGQVWLAEQTAPVQRRVALKLIRGGLLDSSASKRFLTERQSLAMMDHPSIAKVFDAGTAPDGQPYFVMEYVRGVPITTYCNQNTLTIQQRIALFIQVCEGVQHAHQKAIVHRDLKPSNILVVEVDGKPLPRIIDFGLAKDMTPSVIKSDDSTVLGTFLGTPGYISPEQADPFNPDVDTRTDVYSLGAILYQLLTGSLPFEIEDWRTHAFHEALRRLREEDPPRPSAKAGRQQGPQTFSKEIGIDSKNLACVLRGDLDCIVMKAIERDRSRRYSTATELAADLERYLRHEPVQSRPPNVSYRMHRYVRRHRVGVAVAAMFAFLLIAFIAIQSAQLRRITRERDRADRIAEFMTGVFKVSDPGQRAGESVTAREVLDNAAKDIDRGLAADPVLRAQMLHIMGSAYLNLGLFSRAQSLFERATVANGSARAELSRDNMRTMHDLAWALMQQGRLTEAESLERRLLGMQQRVVGPDDPDSLATESELAFTLCERGNCAEGIKLNSEVLEKQKRILGPDHRNTLITMDNLAINLAQAGRTAEAAKLEQESLDLHLRVFGSENMGTVNALCNLAGLQRDLGQYQQAEQGLLRAFEIESRIFGPDQPETAETRYDLASIYAQRGQNQEALSFLEQAVDHGLPPRIVQGLAQDPLFQSLREEPGFNALLVHVKKSSASH